MSSHLSADRPAAQPPMRGSVEALISQTRRLRGEVDAVRRDTNDDAWDPHERWQRALYDLALHQLNDLDEHLAQLRDGPPPVPSEPARTSARPAEPAVPVPAPAGPLLSRVGSAEWNLLTDAASWSEELYQILGRSPSTPALTLDELPSLVLEEDRPKLTAMVTGCLVDAKPIDGEFRVVRPDGIVRTVHMMGEPVPDSDGSTASMWAVLRDVSELRSSQRTVRERHDSLHRHRQQVYSGRRPAVEEDSAPVSQGLRGSPCQGPGPLDIAGGRLPGTPGPSVTVDGNWYDVAHLPDGDTLLGAGDLTRQVDTDASGRAMLMGAVRGMAMTGTRPGRLLDLLNQLLTTDRTAPCSAVCCRYRPADRTLEWAQAGHPVPLLYRDGTGRVLAAPEGVLLGTAPSAAYGQAETALEPGDLLLLRTNDLVRGQSGADAVDRLLDLAPRFAAATTAEDCVRVVVEEFGADEREDSASVLIARLSS